MRKLTVAAQIKQTVASLKGIQATLDTFSSFAEDEEAKTLLKNNSEKVYQVIDRLEQRVKVLEFEEPQYKGF
ncbi:DUF1657 domain-containing protein [Desulforamulus ruminis]|uniref:DUF1657 domain-containing protein n=1 Tax=Desulforamulus ruminis TaxID=1564 RepID=UPI002FD969B8